MRPPWLILTPETNVDNIKGIAAERLKMYGLIQAWPIFVYIDYPYGWHAVCGIYNPHVGDYEVAVIFCVWGALHWGFYPVAGILPSGAPSVDYWDVKPEY